MNARRSAVLWLGMLLALIPPVGAQDLSLDGRWEVGEERRYGREVPVPGLAQDPGKPSPGTLWYRRPVTLPAGDWTRATLRLGGARFAPTVYIDGVQVSASEGGMAPTVHPLGSPAVAPGRTVVLEIALKSLSDLDPHDASATPGADRWRTNISSGLWDSASLHFSGGTRVARLTPWTHFGERTLDVAWTLDAARPATGPRLVQAVVLDAGGTVLAESAPVLARDGSGTARIDLGHACQPWSPDVPNLYRLRVIVREAGKIEDQQEISWGLREFKTDGIGFRLNGDPVHLRAGTVVWPRFLRDPEATTVAFDTAWFETNVAKRLQSLGANTVRFHLGLPPETLLDLCDRRGLMVQMEWPFFHGIAASPASLRVQWRAWLDVAMRHPCVVLLHPWNETEGAQLEAARAALADVARDFPPLVISHRDVTHVHKYWWSLFENLGLYYDSASEFKGPIMADEFGGNYLDRNGNPGGYPATREAFARFLGHGHTREMRLRHHAESNALVAEYWRRLGVAGFSPFCILGSLQDGNGWFLGPLAHPEPMPVWSALAAAYSPQSVSLEIWTRNFVPGQAVEVPMVFFNDRLEASQLDAVVRVMSEDGKSVSEQKISALVAAFGTSRKTVAIHLPTETGEWRLEAELLTPVRGVTVPIVSAWRCRTLRVTVPPGLANAALGVPPDETELRAMFAAHGLRVTEPTDPAARALVLSSRGWAALLRSPDLREQLETAVRRGQSVVLLDAGPTDLARYQTAAQRNLDGAPVLAKSAAQTQHLFAGIDVVFRDAAEPESHFHPAPGNDVLWHALPREATWLWNGLRGGLVVPPYEMDVIGLSPAAFVALWSGRGADAGKLSAGEPCFAYDLAGYYAFSDRPKDEAAIKELRRRVKFLVDDAPSLQGRIDPEGAVNTTDLAAVLRAADRSADASELVPLANCGKNLTRVPVVMVGFGPGRGRVVLSQLLTAGRLAADEHPPKLYEIGHDPVAEQMVLNMVDLATGR